MFQPDLLKGRSIFLTGGGTGLGRSMALHFAKLGARLFVIGRREEPLKKTCEEIHRDGGAAAYTTATSGTTTRLKPQWPPPRITGAKLIRW